MPPVDRKNPIRAASSESKYSVMEFMREFPDDESCLIWLWENRRSEDGKTAFCPKCELDRPFHKVKARPAWDCDYCGYHLHPTAGTIFHKSSTSLQLWFYAMFLISQTRCGISAKQLERELGVTYKTAWRMLNLIRNQLMDQEQDEPLSGDVEVDETAGGGKVRASDTRKGPQHVAMVKSYRPTVWGAVERGGRVRVKIVRSRGTRDVELPIYEHVLPASMIFTDEWKSYRPEHLERTFLAHRRIRHEDRIYVEGDVHTQTIEGFFGLFKNGVRGTYHAVSTKWLQGYLNEFAWRYNRRHAVQPMFKTLIEQAAS